MNYKKHILSTAVTACLLLPQISFATNGAFSHGFGTKNKSMAGAGVASPQSAFASALNPAGLAFVEQQWDLGLELFAPRRGYSANPTTNGNVNGSGSTSLIDSKNGWFPIPSFAFNWKMDNKNSLGLALYGNGGMNTEYDPGDTFGGLGTLPFRDPTNTVQSSGTVGINLEQLFINASFAHKISQHTSLGVSAIVAVQRLNAKGLTAFMPLAEKASAAGAASNFTNGGTDTAYGVGFKIGYQGIISKSTAFAASYQSEVSMGGHDKYANFLPGDMNIPATASIGITTNMSKTSSISIDVQHIAYSDVEAYGNKVEPFLNNCAFPRSAILTANAQGDFSKTIVTDPGTNCVGSENGPGFGWNDMTVYKIGYQIQSSPETTWRFGISRGNQPIDSSQIMFNMLAPATVENHFTFGFTEKMNKGEFNLGVMYAPKKSITGTNPFDSTQTVTIEMNQFAFEGSWSSPF